MTVPETMCAVQLTGYGGLDKLVYRSDVAVPRPKFGWVLIRVTAAGMNNTDINTRIGWYSPKVGDDTAGKAGEVGLGISTGGMGDWTGDVQFPRIQGADCVGRIVAVGSGVNKNRIGERVLCMPYIYNPDDPDWLENAGILGAEYDGAFAQYVTVPAQNAIVIPEETKFTDSQLATLPCSGGTAMNMLSMAEVVQDDVVLVTGASGGVGTFLVQIAKYFGAKVVAVCGQEKADAVRAVGADAIIDRNTEDLIGDASSAMNGQKFSLVADVVGGSKFPEYLSLLRRGGRYVAAGAIGGAHVNLDLRTLYLKNLSFFGSTVYLPKTFPSLIQVLLAGGLQPAVASIRPLSEIHTAQRDFLEKNHVGSMVLIPPQNGESD